MNKLRQHILSLLEEEKKELYHLYDQFLKDHAYIWQLAEKEELENIREVLLVMIKLFYHEHRQLNDIKGVDYETFRKAVRELLTNRDALLQKARNAQVDEIEFFGPEKWFDMFKRDIERINHIIESYEGQIGNIIGAAEKHFLYPHDISTQYWRRVLDIMREEKDKHGPGGREKFEFFAHALKGKPLLDLGCGDQSLAMLQFAYAAGATSYIGVDKVNLPEEFDDPTYKLRVLEKKYQTEFSYPGFSVHYVKADLLDYTAKVHNHANIVINGIDSDVWEDAPEVRQYITRLLEQIARIIPPKGIVFGSGTGFLNSFYIDNRFHIIENIPGTKERFSYSGQCIIFQRD